MMTFFSLSLHRFQHMYTTLKVLTITIRMENLILMCIDYPQILSWHVNLRKSKAHLQGVLNLLLEPHNN